MQLQEGKHNTNHKLNVPPYILRYKNSTVQGNTAGGKERNTEWIKEMNTSTSRSNTRLLLWRISNYEAVDTSYHTLLLHDLHTLHYILTVL